MTGDRAELDMEMGTAKFVSFQAWWPGCLTLREVVESGRGFLMPAKLPRRLHFSNIMASGLLPARTLKGKVIPGDKGLSPLRTKIFVESGEQTSQSRGAQPLRWAGLAAEAGGWFAFCPLSLELM